VKRAAKPLFERPWQFLAGAGLFGGRTLIFPLNGFVDFLSVNGNLRGGFDTEADFVAPNIDHGDLDVVTNEDALVTLPG
jgi:hypothetical protein